MSPAIVLTVASAALSCYWQKQIHDQLQQVNKKIDSLIEEVHRAKDATLSTAEDEIRTLSVLPIGSNVTVMPSAIADAITVLHNEASTLVEQRASVRAWMRGASLTDVIEAASRIGPEIVRFHRALAIDNQWTRVQLMSEAALGAPSFRDQVLERADSRRRMIQDVAEVLRPMAQTSLIDDRTGAGEHLIPWTHGDRLKSRRGAAGRALRQLNGMNDVLDHDWRAIPRAIWWDNPYAIDMYQDAAGNPNASVVALPR
jgi:hypothetical protein